MRALKMLIAKAVLVGLVVFCSVPVHVQGQGLPGFSGYPAATPIPCLCTATVWSLFAPLYLTAVPIVGAMVYSPATTLPYPYFFQTIPASSHVGAYIPGVQACWIWVGLSCVPLPDVGLMLYLSTGIPGASLPGGAGI